MKKFISAIALSAILAATASHTLAGVVISDAIQPTNCVQTEGVVISDFTSFVSSIIANATGVVISDVVKPSVTQCNDHEVQGVVISD